jgi:uncharacterized protein
MVALALVPSCRSAPPQASVPDAAPAPTATVLLFPEGHPDAAVRVRVVKSEATRRRGLMYVRALPEDEGMLFLFPEEEQQSFWMRNTYVPLDMIFIRSDLTVLGVAENARPLTDNPRFVEGESQYVLEVNAGWARKHGVREGTRVKLDGVSLENIEP